MSDYSEKQKENKTQREIEHPDIREIEQTTSHPNDYNVQGQGQASTNNQNTTR